MLLAPDVTLGSRYKLKSRIAVGGMGEVWRADDTVLHREVAVKVLKGDLTGDPSFLDRFRAEARHTAALAHPGIANVFDYGEATTAGSEQTDAAFLVMELVDGEPMSALLGRERRLPADQALDIIAQTANALGAAHAAGVIHRDVKPGNILIRPDGTVKITDFGIARAVNQAPVTATGMVMGTSFYLSPEQASGQLVTPTSDVYSLGVVGYEALAGQRPFAGDSPLTVAMKHIREPPPPLPADVPPAARAVIERAMAKDPAVRFPSAAAMAEAATAARGGAATDYRATAAMVAPPRRVDPTATSVMPPVPNGYGSIPPSAAAATTAPIPIAPAPRRQQARGRPATVVLLVAGLLAFLLFALIAYLITQQVRGDASETTPPTPSAASSRSATSAAATPTVTVNAASYLGRDYEQVEADLTKRGLTVRVLFAGKPGKTAKPGTVTKITPTGRMTVGTRVTITAVPAKGTDEKDD